MHVGTQNVTKQMEPYIYKRTKEGVHYLDLAKTWEKLMVAARIIGAVQEKNRKDVLVSIIHQLNLHWHAVNKYARWHWQLLQKRAHVSEITQSVTHASSIIQLGCVESSICPESRTQVCHLHQMQLPRWKVGPRNTD